jgi:transcriptional regulator with XRE-family HTH domain
MAKNFNELRKQVRSDPERAARVMQHKAAIEAAMDLAELRRRGEHTQADLARLMKVTQENVSRIERSAANGESPYLSTLSRYVAALGGRLEVNAVFDDETVPLALLDERSSERT